MAILKRFFYQGEHHFLLTEGDTYLGTPAGVWASYIPPQGGNKGVVMMLYATKEHRHYIAHVLGALALHSLKVYKELPEGSHNLSPHSLGIQRRLAGILGQLEATAAINNENWFNSINYTALFSSIVNTVSAEDITYDIEQGKEFLLSLLRDGYATQQ